MPFLLHDDTLERTTSATAWPANGRGPSCRGSTPAVGTAGAYAGEPIASFEAIAAFCTANGYALDLEIKPSPGTEPPPARAVGDGVRRLWRGAPPPLLSSFKPQALMGARETAPELPRALLLDTLWPGCMEMAASLDCVAIITNHTLMDAALLAQIHAAGRRALVYTVNDAAAGARVVALGIDGIVTDAVDCLGPDDPQRAG